MQKTLDKLTSARFSECSGAVKLTIDSVIRVISDICRECGLSGDLYTALLNEGVLTQGLDYDGNEYVYITYERLEDYFLADRIVEAYGQLSEEEFIQKYSWVLNRPDLLQYVGIIFAELKNKELCDVFSVDDEMNKYQIRDAFLYGLLWRKTDSITERTIEYVNSEIFAYQYSFGHFIDILFAVSARLEHRFNAHKSFGFFARGKMPDRDSEFVPIFDKLYDDPDSALHRLVEWGCFYSNSQRVDEYIAECYASILCWLLISPNNLLRDRATKAMRRILESHIDALMIVMNRFEDIDDPYILERIYAVAFGGVVEEKDPQKVRKLAQYVYVNVFDKEEVYPNILLRTFAKNIIDYARYIGCLNKDDFCKDKITPPYKSKFPSIPTDEEISKYKIGYDSPGFKDYHWAQNAILSSMKVNSSRDGYGGGYGYFGRYIFQAYFAAWPQLHPIDLKNIAIKRIFDLGYDVEKHGEYDRHCTNHVIVGNQRGKRERIGKKYQWIALYDLAARVSDSFTRNVEDESCETHQEYCKGSFNPNIRNIDPTIMAFSNILSEKNNVVEYSIPDITFEDWLDDFDSPPIPTFEQCVKTNYNGHEFLLVAGEHKWSDEKKLGYDCYEFPRKRLWHLINAYIVKHEHSESLLSSLDGVDFMGRWMPEAHDESSMYNKEYYWSEADKFFKTPFYCGEDWVDIDFRDQDINFPEKVLVPVKRYLSERRGDLNVMPEDVPALSWYKPCEELFSKLRLQYKCNSNSVFVDGQGEMVCFDSSELLGQDIGFYIRRDKLIKFLQDNGYALIWTSLCEKDIISRNRKYWNLPPKALHRSAVYQFNDGTITKINENMVEDKLYY